jgi:hypothetical protein
MPTVELILSLAVFIGLPLLGGAVINWALTPERKPGSLLEWLLLSFVYGLALWVWLTVIGYYLKLHLVLVGFLYLAAVAALAAVGLARTRLRPRLWEKSGDRIAGIVLLIALLIGIIYFFIGACPEMSDSFRHLAFINRLVSREALDLDTFIFSANIKIDSRLVSYSYNGTYPLFAFVSKIFGLHAAAFWIRLPLLLVPLLLSATYLLLRRFVRSSPAALAALLLLFTVSWYQAFEGNPFKTISYPRLLGTIAYFGLVWFFLKQNEEGKSSPVQNLMIIAAGASLTAVHIQIWVYFALTLGVLVAHTWWRQGVKAAGRPLMIWLLFILLSFVPLMLRITIYGDVQGGLEAGAFAQYSYLFLHVGPFYMLDPVNFLSSDSYVLILFAVAVVVTSIFRKRTELPAYLTFPALMVCATAFLILCPLTVPLIARFGTALMVERLFKLMYLWGFILVAAATAYLLLEKNLLAKTREFPLRSLGALATAALGIGALLLGSLTHVLGKGIEPAFWAAAAAAWVLVGSLVVFFSKLFASSPAGDSRFPSHLRRAISRLREASVKHTSAVACIASLAYLSIFLFLPRSILNIGHQLAYNENRAFLKGPRLDQILASPQLQRMFSVIGGRAVIITDRQSQDMLLAFSDVYLSAGAKERYGRDKELREYVDRVLEFSARPEEAVEVLRTLAPDYLVLSPLTSNLAWQRWDHYPQLLEPVFRERVEGIDFLNKTYVVYKVNKEALSKVRPAAKATAGENALEEEPYAGPIRRVEVGFSAEIEQTARRQAFVGSNLLVWETYEPPPWYYYEADLGGPTPIHELVLHTLEWWPALSLLEAAVFAAGNDKTFSEISRFSLEGTENSLPAVWRIPCGGRKARYLRIALNSRRLVPLCQVEIFARDKSRIQKSP